MIRPFPWIDVAVIALLVALNAFLSLSELAIVSARRARLQGLARNGERGAAAALTLAEEPGKFLSTVQIGITLIGILVGAFSGASLGGPVADRLAGVGVAPDTARSLGFTLVIVVTTYVSLVVGELIPKQLALRAAEPIAVAVAPAMLWLARISAPLAWVLDRSSALVLALFPARAEANDHVGAEEVQMVVAEAQASGTIDEGERQMIAGVMRMAERTVRAIMTPRIEVEWLDAAADDATTRARLIATPHTRLIVAEGTVDDILGVVEARELLAVALNGEPIDLRALARRAPVVPDVMDASNAIGALQAGDVPIALVHDEYGHFEGIVTPANLLAAIAGAFRSDLSTGQRELAVEGEDGAWTIAGAMPADEMAEHLGLTLPETRDYETAAGFVLAALRHLPTCGEYFTTGDWRFEVARLEGRKIDRLHVTRITETVAY